MNKSEPDPQDQEDNNARSKQRGRGKKRKRPASTSSTDEETVLPDNTLEVEKNLHASAIKNNLDDASVKKILKKVVTNDHVLALVKLREEEESSSTEENLQPKLTRAKAKELMKASPKSAPWNLELTPIKHIPVKTRPEVKALIAQELPDDEDDEEYEPTNDDVPSDDEHILESSSDVDSLPRTPVTPNSQRNSSTQKVVNDGPFKVPQDVSAAARRKLVLDEEEATIALRTRSKLSLSSTSIEHIESSFVPPDEPPTTVVDSLWNDFLNDCLNPASTARNEDDDETDPEYSVAADPDADEEDEESLENSIIKISKKELNDLMTELFSIVPEGATEQLAENMMQEVLTGHSHTEQPTWEGKQEPLSDEENNTEIRRSSISMPAPITVKRESNTRICIGKSEPHDEQDDGNTEVNHAEEYPHCTNKNENEPISSKQNMLEKIQAEIVQDIKEITKENELNQKAKESASRGKEKENSNGEKKEKEYPSILRTVLAGAQETVRVELPKEDVVLGEQRLILAQQLRQHVQLAAAAFLQLYAHPEHWQRAPTYKDFLMTLHKIGQQNPASVVNVCNLKPAVELVTCWETTVSDNSPENIKMVEFVVKEVEKSRRRIAQNSSYMGNFPEMYLKVVANSPVFLYPHLLPPMPYRPDNVSRKSIYLRSEDELIALGLAQFWEYVSANPDLFKEPVRPHPRRRWGLAASVRLLSRHMLPWLSPKMLISHISLCRKTNDETNPIVKFFKTMRVEPVKHTLVPFDPRRTLHEQPELDMPRVWLRYLAHTAHTVSTKRLLKRKSDNLCKAPEGVDVNVAMVSGQKKVALSKDFTKKITSNRLNQLPPKTIEQFAPKITIVPMQPNVYTVIKTSVGSYLVPIHVQTMTVNSNTAPICAPSVATSGVSESKNTENGNNESVTERNLEAAKKEAKLQKSSSDHCQCCLTLRKIRIRRYKQKSIFDYFKPTKGSRCDCKGKRYPKITNRLKLLVNNFKVNTECIYNELKKKILALEKQKEGGSETISDDVPVTDDNGDDDFAVAMSYHLKLTFKTAVTRDNWVKRRIHTLFSKFDLNDGSALQLAKDFEKICHIDLVEMYKEFVGFLTPEQADELGHYKDYFVQRCETKLIGKIEAVVQDKQERIDFLDYLKGSFHTNYYMKWSSCEICTELLHVLKGYPELMEYAFSLFPHQRVQSPTQQESAISTSNDKGAGRTPSQLETMTNSDSASLKQQESVPVTANGALSKCQESNSMDYEADHSSSDEDNEEKNNPKNDEVEKKDPKDFELKQEVDLDVVNISIRKASSSESSEMSMLVMSDEDAIKTEAPDWKREEDKTILEILKQHITPEERKDITILDIMKDTPIIQMITDSLSHKSIDDIKERILYLLQLLVGSDNSVE